MCKLNADDVQWVVNDDAELGVKIGDQFFFLYKGESLQPSREYSSDMKWRPVQKREFGESCRPTGYWDGYNINTHEPDFDYSNYIGDNWQLVYPGPKTECYIGATWTVKD